MKTDPDQRVLNKAITWRRSVVLILRTRIHNGKTSNSNGSGFIIKTSGADCQVITNRHVVQDDGTPFNRATDKIFVRVMCEPDGVEELPGSIRFIHPLVDLALIEVRGMTEQMPRPLRFTSAHEEPIGATAIAIGYCNPRSIGNKRLLVRTPSVCPGSKVGPLFASAGDSEGLFLHIDSSTMTGCSGGPVVCNKGVMGVFDGYFDQVGSAVCTESVLNVLKDWLRIPRQDTRTIHQLVALL